MLLSSFLVYAALAQDSEPKTISLTDAERALVARHFAPEHHLCPGHAQ